MIALYHNESGARLGSITEEQLEFLMDQLEQETPEDREYFIDRSTVEMLQEAGADAEVLELLREALGEEDEVEIRWEHP
jgi:hypothetical protein